MWWQTIIIDVLSVTSILSIIAMIRFWKQNKKLKDNEVKINDSEVAQADVEAQKAKIDLANLYKQNMLDMMEQFKKNDDNQALMIEKLDRLDERMEKVEKKVGDIESYLNGPYHQYLAEKQNRYNPNIKPNEDSSKS